MNKIHILKAESLIDKHGFCDSDQFIREVEEFYNDCDKNGIKPPSQLSLNLIIIIVEEYLLPKLPFKFMTIKKVTMHNPIRISSIDGEEINKGNYKKFASLLSKTRVEVTSDQVREIIREIANGDRKLFFS